MDMIPFLSSKKSMDFFRYSPAAYRTIWAEAKIWPFESNSRRY